MRKAYFLSTLLIALLNSTITNAEPLHIIDLGEIKNTKIFPHFSANSLQLPEPKNIGNFDAKFAIHEILSVPSATEEFKEGNILDAAINGLYSSNGETANILVVQQIGTRHKVETKSESLRVEIFEKITGKSAKSALRDIENRPNSLKAWLYKKLLDTADENLFFTIDYPQIKDETNKIQACYNSQNNTYVHISNDNNTACPQPGPQISIDFLNEMNGRLAATQRSTVFQAFRNGLKNFANYVAQQGADLCSFDNDIDGGIVGWAKCKFGSAVEWIFNRSESLITWLENVFGLNKQDQEKIDEIKSFKELPSQFLMHNIRNLFPGYYSLKFDLCISGEGKRPHQEFELNGLKIEPGHKYLIFFQTN